MGDTILLRRGTLANLPDLQEGEPGWCTDQNQLYMGTDTGTAESAIPLGHYDYIPSAFTQAAIETTFTAIGTSSKVTLLLRPGTWVISSDANWSAYTNVTFKIVPGAVISHGAFTVTMPVPDAGLQQIYVGTGTVTFCGSFTAVYPQWFPGTDAGLQIQAAVNSLPATGGIVDGRGYTGTQTISATITWGASSMAAGNNEILLFNPATKFQPATVGLTMFNPQPSAQLSGLHVNATNIAYTGIVILVQDNSGVGGYIWNYTETQNTLFENINIYLPTGGGTAIKLGTVDTGAPGAGTGISFVTFRSVRVMGGAIGIHFYVDAASHFISSNIFQDVMISNCYVGVAIGSDPVIGSCFYNNFTDLTIQMGTPGVYGIEMLNGLGNQFINLAIWDPNTGAGAKTIYTHAGSYKNIFMGQLGVNEATLTDIRNLFLDSGSGSAFNNEPTYKSLRTSSLTVEGPTYNGELGAATTLYPSAEISKMFTVADAGTFDVATVKFDSAYAGAIIEVEVAGQAGSQLFLARATRSVRMNNNSPTIATIGTDDLNNATIAFSYVATSGIKATVTNVTGGAVVADGAARMHVVGGGQGLGILSIQ